MVGKALRLLNGMIFVQWENPREFHGDFYHPNTME